MNLIKMISVIFANKLTCIIFILPFSVPVLKLIYGSQVSKNWGMSWYMCKFMCAQVHVFACAFTYQGQKLALGVILQKSSALF